MGIEDEAERHCLESQTDQVNELNAQRAAVYGLLARLVRTEVDRETLIGLAELQPALGMEEGLLREGYRRMGDFARQAVGQEGALGQRWALGGVSLRIRLHLRKEAPETGSERGGGEVYA